MPPFMSSLYLIYGQVEKGASAAGFVPVLRAMLGDVQERLIFRALIYIQVRAAVLSYFFLLVCSLPVVGAGRLAEKLSVRIRLSKPLVKHPEKV